MSVYAGKHMANDIYSCHESHFADITTTSLLVTILQSFDISLAMTSNSLSSGPRSYMDYLSS